MNRPSNSASARSADFQSAVLPTCSRLSAQDGNAARNVECPADYKSAIQQSAALRYDPRATTGLGFTFSPLTMNPGRADLLVGLDARQRVPTAARGSRRKVMVGRILTPALSLLRGENPPDFVRALRPVTSRELFWPAWTTKGCLP